MTEKEFTLVYINLDYLRTLYSYDTEVQFVENSNYESKPHLGILQTINGNEYVIPLTSAKPKHVNWRDRTNYSFRIYEIIDVRSTPTDPYDIMDDIKNEHYFTQNQIDPSDRKYYKKRILSVLDLRKMLPVKNGVYTKVNLDTAEQNTDLEKRRLLMKKEIDFCRNMKSDIIRRANSIYTAQIDTGHIRPMQCDYRKLEMVCEQYLLNNRNKDTE